MEIRTLALVFGLIHFLQVVVFLLKAHVHRREPTNFWWMLWSFSGLLAVAALLLRGVYPQAAFLILLQNVFFTFAVVFLYTGILRFFGKHPEWVLLSGLMALFFFALAYYIYIRDQIAIRTFLISVAWGSLSLLMARTLWVQGKGTVRASAVFLAGVSLAHGLFMIVRGLWAFQIGNANSIFLPSAYNTSVYLDGIAACFLWACGIVIMTNQRARTDLSEAKSHFEHLFHTSPDASVISNLRDGTIVDANEAFSTFTGYPREELVGHRMSVPGFWGDPTLRRAILDELDTRGSCVNKEIVLDRKNGGRVVGLFSAKVLAVKGQPHILSVIRDITERAKDSAERDHLLTAIEQAAEVILVTDRDGLITYANPAFEAVTGYSRAECLGQNPRFLKSGEHPPALYEELWSTLWRGEVWRGRLVNRCKNGSRVTVEATLSPVRDAKGEIASFVAVKRDISRDLALEAKLLSAQRLDGIGRLAGGIAHDFNNLLTVILNNAGLAHDAIPEGHPARADLGEVRTAAERAATLTRQLLAFSRKQVLQSVLLDLNRVVSDMEKMLQRILGEDIELVARLAPELGLIRADAGQLEQVIMNLVVNARDAMPQGGLLTIETSNTEDGGEKVSAAGAGPRGACVQLTVTDNGCGMDASTQAAIFEPFFTTKDQGKGTGLGLATVYGIVHQSDGQISVVSAPGKGTTFRIQFPRVFGGPLPSAPIQTPAPRSGGHETILLAEDEGALLRLAKQNLEKAGYSVLTAEDGLQALEIGERYPGVIHLLLTDMVMPRLNGKDLARELSARRPAMKVLFMSGYNKPSILGQEGLPAGARFLLKPFFSERLLQTVRDALDDAAVVQPGGMN